MDKSRIDEALKMADDKAAMLEGITLKDDVFDRFIVACEAADAPNKKLREALELSWK